jgi:hypothetical protein
MEESGFRSRSSDKGNISRFHFIYWVAQERNSKKTKLRGLSPRANYTERLPFVGEVSAYAIKKAKLASVWNRISVI